MQFYEICRRAKRAHITVMLRDGPNVKFFPESFDYSKGLGREPIDLTGLMWLTNPVCADFKNYYVTNIEPTGNGYMTVTLVKHGVINELRN